MNESTIRIGGLGPLTFPGLTWAGHELKDGMTLAIEQINDRGGVLDRQLELLFEDTQGRPEVGIAAVEKLIQKRVHFFAGEFHSLVADAIVESIQQSNLPFLCASATLDSITARRLSMVFRIAPPQSFGWAVYADFLASHNFRHVVILQEDNIYWNCGSRIIEARLKDLGVRFTRLSLTAGSTDVLSYIQEVRDLRSEHPAPDMLLLLVAYPVPFIPLTIEAKRHRLVPPEFFLGDPAGRIAYRWDIAGTNAMQIPFLSYMQSQQSNKSGKSITKEFKSRFGREPTFIACEGYDSILVLTRACTDAGTIDPEAVCNSLRTISVIGTQGTIQFSSEPDGVVHQQWKWPPVRVVAYNRPKQSITKADLLWDAKHGRSGRAYLLRETG